MIWLFAYGQLMTNGPYTATVNGEMRMRTGKDPAARFGLHYTSLVYGQLQQKTRHEMQKLSFMELPQYALHQVGSWRGHPIYAYVDIQPEFELEPLVPSGMFRPKLHASYGTRHIEKARKYGPGHKPPGKTKVVVTEARLNTMAKAMSEAVKVNLLGGIRSIKQGLSADDMRRSFMRQDYSKVMEQLRPTLKGATQEAVSRAIGGVHEAVLDKLPSGARDVLQYNASNPGIGRYIERRSGALITTSEQGLREAVRAMTTGALNKGTTPAQSAQYVRDVIGLNAPQARALANYKANLIGQGVPESRVSELARGQSERMLDYRAEMIARTEVRNAQNAGQLDIWRQGVKDELLPKSSRKVWQVDGAPCEEWCQPMDGVTVPLDEPFRVTSTSTGDVVEVDVPSEIHPHCMCIMQIEMPDEDEPASAPEE